MNSVQAKLQFTKLIWYQVKFLNKNLGYPMTNKDENVHKCEVGEKKDNFCKKRLAN